MFHLDNTFIPRGDQPKAIAQLMDGIRQNKKAQVLLGITGSGKTFTMANIIAQTQKPTLVLAHNKTLAAQLYEEFRQFFPNNAVEYFVSYYDYYQPEAYIARTDTYVEKSMAINEKIDRLRLSATRSLFERKDVIVVASISCIYGLGMPEYYQKMNIALKVGDIQPRQEFLLRLVEVQYNRDDIDFSRGKFRVRGEVIDIFPAYEEDRALRLRFFDDEIESIQEFDPLTGKILCQRESVILYPASHHVIPEEVRFAAYQTIERELKARIAYFESQGRSVEAERIAQRTKYDLEMIREIGFCKGIENYSRHFSNRPAGSAPACLLDYFPEDFLFLIDESHQTVPQIHAMSQGDKARKTSLIEFGFRLPSAYDNRPLRFEEVYPKMKKVIYVSATPGNWEVSEAQGAIVEQIIRPTGLLDPIITIRPAVEQVNDCVREIQQHTATGGKVLITTLTKKMAEELTTYLLELSIKAKYLHSDIETLERMEIIQALRQGEFDVLIGINLLREGLDIPEVSLVAILDADKQGFLRSKTSLIQTCGRAARNSEGRVIMYADVMTDAILETVRITKERRTIQEVYNKEHGIVPKTVIKETSSLLLAQLTPSQGGKKVDLTQMSVGELEEKIAYYASEMKKAAQARQFEEAAKYRDLMHQYQRLQLAFE